MKLFKDVWNKRGFKDGPGPVIRKNVAVRNMLEQLHSPNDPEQLYREYQKKKGTIMGIIVIIRLPYWQRQGNGAEKSYFL